VSLTSREESAGQYNSPSSWTLLSRVFIIPYSLSSPSSLPHMVRTQGSARPFLVVNKKMRETRTGPGDLGPKLIP